MFRSARSDGAWRTVASWTRVATPAAALGLLLGFLPGVYAAAGEGTFLGYNEPTGRKWAVVIGISKYQDPAVPPLTFAARDAQKFADFLTDPKGGGFEPDRVKLLTDEQATKTNVEHAFEVFLRRNAVRDDLVVVYITCHGQPEPTNPKFVYLLTHDTKVADDMLSVTAIEMAEFRDVFRRKIKAKRVVMFIDACHSGDLPCNVETMNLKLRPKHFNDGMSRLGRRVEREGDGSRRGPQEPGTSMDRVIVTASQGNEVAQAGAKWDGGVFTHYLVQGLRGHADANLDRSVSLDECYKYVERSVAVETGNDQTPDWLTFDDEPTPREPDNVPPPQYAGDRRVDRGSGRGGGFDARRWPSQPQPEQRHTLTECLALAKAGRYKEASRQCRAVWQKNQSDPETNWQYLFISAQALHKEGYTPAEYDLEERIPPQIKRTMVGWSSPKDAILPLSIIVDFLDDPYPGCRKCARDWFRKIMKEYPDGVPVSRDLLDRFKKAAKNDDGWLRKGWFGNSPLKWVEKGNAP